MTPRVVHVTNVFEANGDHYAFCRLSCGWSGPWRRWAWRARRDARRHVAAVGAPPAGRSAHAGTHLPNGDSQ